MSDLKFADTHNLVAFLEKPTKSEGFKEIVDFLNANPIKYALTVNPTIYCSCVKQLWDTIKEKTVNEEIQLQALVDKKKVILTESTIRRDLQLEDANGVDRLPNAREGNGFSGRVTPLFLTIMVQAQEEMGEEPIVDEATNEENVPTQSNDPPLSRVNTLRSGEDRLKLKELIDLCTKLSDRVFNLETTKTTQAEEIASLNNRVNKLERKYKSKTLGMKRLFKIGRSAQVISSKDEGLGDQEDASKQGRKIVDIDVDAEQEVEVEKVVNTAEVTTKSATTTVDELTLAQTLIEIKAAKPKVRGGYDSRVKRIYNNNYNNNTSCIKTSTGQRQGKND
ncbi:hypothetical protein Tco_0638003 [Tanacetum coccineum]